MAKDSGLTAQELARTYRSSGPYQTQLGGTRLSLFQSSISITDSKLSKLKVAVRYEMQRKAFEVSDKWAKIIRGDAPVLTGAMQAGVYVINSPSQKVQAHLRKRTDGYQRLHAISPKAYKDYVRAVTEAQSLRPSLKTSNKSGKSSYQEDITGRVRARSRKTIHSDFEGASLTETFKDMPINEFAYTSEKTLYVAIAAAVYYSAIVDSMERTNSGKTQFFSRNMPGYKADMKKELSTIAPNIYERLK